MTNIPVIAKSLIANSNGLLRWGGRKKGAYRIQQTNPEDLVEHDIIENIVTQSNCEIVNIIEPGFTNSLSGRYKTWSIKQQDTNLNFNVVFGLGRNRGQHFEDVIVNELISAHHNKTNSILYNNLLNKIGLQENDIVTFKKASSRSVKRTITTDINNIGAQISDIDIHLTNGETIHLSLKNENGDTYANAGYHGGFSSVQNEWGRVGLRPSSHELDDFVVNGLGIDKTLAAQNINFISAGGQVTYLKCKPTYNEDKIKQYLCSAYGYGYWYVRGHSNNKWEIIDLTSPEKVVEKIGKILSVSVSYPYFEKKIQTFKKRGVITKTPIIKSSKQITSWITTDKATFIVEIRNSHRGFNPNEVKIKITKPKTCLTTSENVSSYDMSKTTYNLLINDKPIDLVFASFEETIDWIQSNSSWDCRPVCGQTDCWYDPETGKTYNIRIQ